MGTTDLRIGNFVTTIDRSGEIHLPTGITKKIGQISFFKVDLYDFKRGFAIQNDSIRIDISDLSPIPLTEEWLLKFGFEKDDLTEGLYTKIMLEYNLEVSQNGFSGTLEKDLLWFITIKAYNNQVTFQKRYVHQLQNLYFSLTGEELTLQKEIQKL